jgi:hypothetical protein
MRRKSMSNSKRAIDKRNRERKASFQEALADGYTSRRDIYKAMGISGLELTEFFEENKKMYKLYCESRRQLRDVALDNITDVVHDTTHPKNYDASKFIVQNYNTDLDIVLDEKGDDSVSATIETSEGSGIIIQFDTKKKEGEKE